MVGDDCHIKNLV